MKAVGTAKVVGVAAVGIACVAATAMVSFADTDESRTVRVSVASGGAQGNGDSAAGEGSVVSNGGRFVAFTSRAKNLVADDTNGQVDVFVRDTSADTTVRVSVAGTGAQADGLNLGPSISPDGRFVVFESDATNLVPDDTNGLRDVFVRDLVRGVTSRVNVDGSGAQATKPPVEYYVSGNPTISADGRYVAFVSQAPNLVSGDTNEVPDYFLRDLVARTTVRVSVSGDDRQGETSWPSFTRLYRPGVSAHGRHVAFVSWASNLVPGDTNGAPDLFVRDLAAGTTVRANVTNDGGQVKAQQVGAFGPSITADGRYVFFQTDANGLVPGDTDGSSDVFRRDLVSGTTTQIRDIAIPVRGFSTPTVSADGRYLSYVSAQPNQVAGDADGVQDAFVRDLATGRDIRVNVPTDGVETGYSAFYPSMSPDGRAVEFSSMSRNLVDGDTNGRVDVFLRELNDAEPAGSYATPTGTFAVNTTSLWSGQAVTLRQVALAGNGNPAAGVGRVVLWGDGSAPQTVAAGATTATHAYPKPGRYRVQVVLVDRAGNRTGAAFDGPSTVTVSAPTAKAALSRSSVFSTQSVSLRLAGVSGAAKVAVAWGDGATSVVGPATTAVAHSFVKVGTFKVTVTAFNAAGAGTPVVAGSVAVVRDTFRPVVTVKAPKNPGVASSWKTVTGTATDRGLGVGVVRMKVAQKRGAFWYAYTGTSWVKVASEQAAWQRAVPLSAVPNAGGVWSRGVTGVTKGTLKVLYSGVDKAGNAAAYLFFTQTITR